MWSIMDEKNDWRRGNSRGRAASCRGNRLARLFSRCPGLYLPHANRRYSWHGHKGANTAYMQPDMHTQTHKNTHKQTSERREGASCHLKHSDV